MLLSLFSSTHNGNGKSLSLSFMRDPFVHLNLLLPSPVLLKAYLSVKI